MMNTKQLVAFASLSLLALVAPGSASAGGSDGLGTWEGSGTASEVSGKDLGAFTVSITRKSVGTGKVRADGKVTLANGKEITLWQDIEERGTGGFLLVSNNGSGGGQCFANGICQTYEKRADGHAFATTMAKDEGGKLRVLVTELENGQALRFFQQTLQKKN
jgi:hypothetical protein